MPAETPSGHVPVHSARFPIHKGVLIVFVGVLTALLGIMYQDIVVELVREWEENPDYSHGFLVPVLSGYFVWERWEKFQGLAMRPSFWGVLLLACGLLALVVGVVGAELYTQRMSMIVVLAGLVLLLLGKEIFASAIFPLAFLIFMIPLPAIVVNSIAFPLQLFAAQTAEYCLFSLGIPVFREGNLISLAGTTLEVAEACSGLRSLLSLLTLATVFAYFSQSVLWKRWILVFLAIPIAIVANAFRVTGTGILANKWGPDAAQGFYHTFEGWVVFIVAFVLLLGSGAILSLIGRRPTEKKRC